MQSLLYLCYSRRRKRMRPMLLTSSFDDTSSEHIMRRMPYPQEIKGACCQKQYQSLLHVPTRTYTCTCTCTCSHTLAMIKGLRLLLPYSVCPIMAKGLGNTAATHDGFAGASSSLQLSFMISLIVNEKHSERPQHKLARSRSGFRGNGAKTGRTVNIHLISCLFSALCLDDS